LIHLVHTCSGWLRRKNGNWQRAARIPRILQWLLAGLMLIIGLAIGILGAKLACRRDLLFCDYGPGDGYRRGAHFPQPSRRYHAVRDGVYRLDRLGD
jgi:hypothetical protein